VSRTTEPVSDSVGDPGRGDHDPAGLVGLDRLETGLAVVVRELIIMLVIGTSGKGSRLG
jgi:hypothetical protein